MYIHKVDKDKHADFLAQNRQDPITGDSIKENEEIVFCKECKSAFLKESWEYIGKVHCATSETLMDFPIQKTLELRVLEDKNALLFPVRNSKNENFEAFANKLDNYYWKKIDIHLRLDSHTKKTIHQTNTLDLKEYKIPIYFCMSLLVGACILVGILNEFSVTGYILLGTVALTALLFPIIYLEDEEFYDEANYEHLVHIDKQKSILYFREDAILIYFDKDKKGYSMEYKDSSQIIFSSQSILISTQKGHQNTFLVDGFSAEQLQTIISLISRSSTSTLLIFKNQPASIQESLKEWEKEWEKEYKNIWIE